MEKNISRFPGNLDLYATYTLDEDALVINYHATSDQDTLINITNHSYFNLNGCPSSIDNHTLQVQAQYFACSDEDGLVTGALRDVDHTPFDFREEKTIGSQIHRDDEHSLQLVMAMTIHSFSIPKQIKSNSIHH